VSTSARRPSKESLLAVGRHDERPAHPHEADGQGPPSEHGVISRNTRIEGEQYGTSDDEEKCDGGEDPPVLQSELAPIGPRSLAYSSSCTTSHLLLFGQRGRELKLYWFRPSRVSKEIVGEDRSAHL
jgi:hypothetical protein